MPPVNPSLLSSLLVEFNNLPLLRHLIRRDLIVAPSGDLHRNLLKIAINNGYVRSSRLRSSFHPFSLPNLPRFFSSWDVLSWLLEQGAVWNRAVLGELAPTWNQTSDWIKTLWNFLEERNLDYGVDQLLQFLAYMDVETFKRISLLCTPPLPPITLPPSSFVSPLLNSLSLCRRFRSSRDGHPLHLRQQQPCPPARVRQAPPHSHQVQPGPNGGR